MDIATLGTRSFGPTGGDPEVDRQLMDKGWAQTGGAGADLIGMLGGGALLKATNLPYVAAAGDALMKPNTLPKAVASGGAYGGLTDAESRGMGATYGAIGGALFPVVAAAAKGTKALIEPLTKAGQERIAARVLQQFGGSSIPGANAQQFVPGSIPTTAEAVGNEGLSTLTQAMRNQSPEFANELADRTASNRAARVAAVRGVAKDDVAMDAASRTRESVAGPLYEAAKQATVKADGKLKMLLTKPSLAGAWKRAERLAAENGEALAFGKNAPAKTVFVGGQQKQVPGHHGSKTVELPGILDASGNPLTTEQPEQFAQYSGRGLHYLKLSLDDMLDDPMSGIGRNEKAALMKTKEQLLGWMDTNIPEYGLARKSYADLSKPINQMEVGQALFDKLQSGLSQMGANTREQAATYANAVNDLDGLVAKVTGVKGIKAADVLTADQIASLKGVAFDLARKAKSEDLARGLGSNTAKNLATGNLLRQAFGPLGLPQSWAESTMMQTAFKPFNLLYGNVAEPRIAASLGGGLLDLPEAQRLLQQVRPNSLSPLLGYTPTLGIAYGAQQ
jgi:hypothetical protein